MARANDLGDQYPSDVGDTLPASPNEGRAIIDYPVVVEVLGKFVDRKLSEINSGYDRTVLPYPDLELTQVDLRSVKVYDGSDDVDAKRTTLNSAMFVSQKQLYSYNMPFFVNITKVSGVGGDEISKANFAYDVSSIDEEIFYGTNLQPEKPRVTGLHEQGGVYSPYGTGFFTPDQVFHFWDAFEIPVVAVCP